MVHDPQPAALIDTCPHGPRGCGGATLTSRLLSTRCGSFCARSWSDTTQSFHCPSSRNGCLFHNFWSTPLSIPSVKNNRELGPDEVEGVLQRVGVPRDKPIMLQVSRFDRFKVLVAAYRPIKKSHDCRLVLAGVPPRMTRKVRRCWPKFRKPSVQIPTCIFSCCLQLQTGDQCGPASRDNYLSKIHQGRIWADSGRSIVEREAGDQRRNRRHYRSIDLGGDRIHREFTRRRGVLHQAFAERIRVDGRAVAAG